MTEIFDLEQFKDTRCIGFDQDSQRAAWACLQGGRYAGANIYHADPERHGLTWPERLQRIRLFVLQLIKDWRPSVVVFEMPMGEHGNPHTNRVLGAALGVCLGAAWQLGEVKKHKGLVVLMVTPTEAQATGVWGKTKVGMAAAKELAKPRKGGLCEHEADALGIALAGWGKFTEAAMLEVLHADS